MAAGLHDIDDKNFEESVLKSSEPVFVDFWAPWCGPCVAMSPILEELASEYEGKVKVTKMNVDENANVPAEYGVRSIPFMVLFKDGQMVDQVVGAVPKAKLKEMFDKVVS